MTDNPQEQNVSLPPKLDLRKAGIMQAGTPSPAGESSLPPETNAGNPIAPGASIQPKLKVKEESVQQVVQIKPPEATPSAEVPAIKIQPGAETSEPSQAPTVLKPTIAPAEPTPLKSEGQPPAAVGVKPAPAKPAAPSTMRPVISDPKRQTSKISLDVAMATVNGAAPQPVSQVPKKETSRISLEATMPTTEGPGKAPAGKLIKPAQPIPVKPLQAMPTEAPATIKLTKPGQAPAAPSISLSPTMPPKEGLASATSAAPKTIRLKKPSEAPTIKVSPGGDKLSKTQRIDASLAGQEAESPTRRKTIKVKRPTKRPTVKAAPETSRGEDQEEKLQEEPAFTDVPTDEPGIAFPLVAIAAILVACVTIYMFLAQVIGPNLSLTQYSYHKDGPDLSWPGKISVR
ncbi:hypothetical protein ACFLS1_02380 [Verrucomicrobiota bacterium]